MYSILLVEDDKALQFIYSKMKIWTEYGFKITAKAANGREALEILREQSFDLVVTDIRMPFIDGIELLRRIKAAEIDTCVVFISSYDEFEYARQGLILGAFDYLVKPVDDNKLGELLGRAQIYLGEKADSNAVNEIVARVIGGTDDPFMKKVERYLSENIYRAVTMTEIADALGLNKDYFGKTFKQHTGMTFNAACSLLKVEYAKALMDTGNYKNYEISEKLGYSSPDYFTKVFKEITGITPQQYRSGQTT